MTFPPLLPPLGPIYDPIGVLDDVQIVLDYDDSIAGLY
jgi:hypothetical protein